MDHCQAHAAAFANCLGGEEWVKDPFHGLRVHSRSVILDNYFDIITRFQGKEVFFPLAQGIIRQADSDFALALPYSLNSVAAEVHQ